jgi:DNA-binding transcriptional regulator YhcF (GntR family)
MAPNDHDKAEKIYKQILDQLEEIWLLYADADEDEEKEEDPSENVSDRDIVDAMIEEGAERGLDEESVEKVFKAISALATKAQDV